MENLISATLTDGDVTDIKAKLDEVKVKLPFLIGLTIEQRKKIFKMGDKSVSFCDEAHAAANNHPTVLPGNFDLNEYNKDDDLYAPLFEVYDYLRPLFESINDTLMVLGNERMRQSTVVYKAFKSAAEIDPTYETIARDLGERFKRAGKTDSSIITLAPAASSSVNGVVPNRLLKNIGTATLDIYKGNAAAGQKITVGGNQQVKIPGGWNVITIVNTDTNQIGIASVIIK